MADLTKSAYEEALKEYYDDQALVDLSALESPFLGMVPRGKFVGKNKPFPMMIEPGQASLSADFSTANTNRAPGTYERFVTDSVRRIYTMGSIERDVIDLAETPRGAFEDIRAEVDGKLRFTSRELAFNLFRSENGWIGEIDAITESGGDTTITFKDPASVANLGATARIVFAATATGALRDSGAVYTVDEVNHTAGTVKLVGETAESTSSVAANDFVFRAGDAPDSGDPVRFAGLNDWITDDAATGTFRGVNRSSAPDKLGGVRVDATTSQVREAASELAARLIANGGRPDRLFVHPLRYSILEQELDSLASHEKVPARNTTAQIGYNGIRIAAGSGSVVIVADPFCPYNRGYMLTMRTWSFLQLGGRGMPRMRNMHGGDLLQLADSDAVKFQCEAKGDLACTNPGGNGVLKFAA